MSTPFVNIYALGFILFELLVRSSTRFRWTIAVKGLKDRHTIPKDWNQIVGGRGLVEKTAREVDILRRFVIEMTVPVRDKL